ncbi:sugar phosphate isomerase/epimerase family protein [Jatrophihabitans sp.]|uniref:sugar phosphate isomerase/epimerase family protein n=1 Tax=Jatrophihabitans sp. TaxID=1932789 RepID=UPI0030C6894D|nr:sugar phosphate isomerase [Jatrophihabitans sp.]
MTAELHPLISINGAYDSQASLADDLALCLEVGAGLVGVPNYKLADAESVALLKRSPVGVSTVCHPDLATLDDPDAWAAQLRAARHTVQLAAELEAQSVYVTTGGRGRAGWRSAASAFVELGAELQGFAASLGLPLLLEATAPGYAELSIIHTLADQVSVCAESGLQLCLDTFASWSDSSFESLLDTAAGNCGLVQIADYALGERSVRDRAVPGDGVIDFACLFAALKRAGFAGPFDLELMGRRLDEEGRPEAFGRSVRWLADQLASYGFELA